MSATPQAIHIALELARQPTLSAAVRRQALPSGGMLDLIRIAGGCSKTCRQAARATHMHPGLVREAAILYLQQALFTPEADAYRVLGVDESASQATIREHMRWLMRWLHPDHNPSEWETAFAARVLSAWEKLKSPQRRMRYDRERSAGASTVWLREERHPERMGIPWIGMPIARPRSRAVRRLGSLALGLLVALAVWLTPWPNLPSPWHLVAVGNTSAEADPPASGQGVEPADRR